MRGMNQPSWYCTKTSANKSTSEMLSRRLQSGLFGHGMPKFVYLAWDRLGRKLERNLPTVAGSLI